MSELYVTGEDPGTTEAVTRLVLHWEREDRLHPGIVGTETLTLELEDLRPGMAYAFPDGGGRAEYEMATPSKGQGAKALSVSGAVQVVEVTPEEVVLEVDLDAEMKRVDRDVTFDERVEGRFRVPRQTPKSR